MNKVIPGSQIIWYDSIVMNGQIAYQNQLNLYNKPFY
jgi:mannosyl-glycoprotein endo-beta-N-acetylglucosaminidase